MSRYLVFHIANGEVQYSTTVGSDSSYMVFHNWHVGMLYGILPGFTHHNYGQSTCCIFSQKKGNTYFCKPLFFKDKNDSRPNLQQTEPH